MSNVRMEPKLWLIIAIVAATCWSSACNSETAAAERRPASQETEQPEKAAARRAEAEKEGRRAQLQADISVLESERNTLASRLETVTKSAGMYQLQSESYQQAIEQQEIATKAFMMDHKMAVIAIGAGVGGAVVLNDREMSDEQKTLGAIGAALAVVWALGHMDEVAQVSDALMQADSHIKDLRTASERADQERQNAEAEMKDLQTKMAGVDQKLSELRASLAAL